MIDGVGGASGKAVASFIQRSGRVVALIGVVLPLLLIGGLTFLVTTSLFLALPVWEASLGGFPALGAAGQFLIKDVALLGISLVVLGESLASVAGNATGRPSPSR